MDEDKKNEPLFPVGTKVKSYSFGNEVLKVDYITQLCCGGFEYIYGMVGLPTIAFRENDLEKTTDRFISKRNVKKK